MKLVYHSGLCHVTPTPICGPSPWQQPCAEFTGVLADAVRRLLKWCLGTACLFTGAQRKALFWPWQQSRDRRLPTERIGLSDKSAQAKNSWRVWIAKQRDQTKPRGEADPFLLLLSHNGLVNYFERVLPQQVNKGSPCLAGILWGLTDLYWWAYRTATGFYNVEFLSAKTGKQSVRTERHVIWRETCMWHSNVLESVATFGSLILLLISLVQNFTWHASLFAFLL